MVHLITGYAGHGHVTAADDALYHAGVCGTGKYVMRTGTMFAASVESSNEITIGSGDLVNQGRHINIPTNATEKATINNGTQGKTRKDVIAIRYKQDASTGVESAELIVLQGASVNTGQTPARPALKSGNLYEGDAIDDFPLYEVTLNNLNTKGMLLDKTDFDINQVIRNTASTFEGTCHNKSIAIEMILTGNEMYVHADMGKIQQVLYNLMDNAIKFSHHDSVIHIETSEKKNKLFVSVKDTGIGIPKEDLKLIWDRFYKSDLSRGKDKKGTGLGLSIVKEIINAHNEHINVISTPGVGSEFIFSLPKSHQEDEED